jgi:hypothetical protein
MKKTLLALVLLVNPFTAQAETQELLQLKSVDGQDAVLIADVQPAEISQQVYRNARIRMGGRDYRIAAYGDETLLKKLCADNKFKNTYSTAGRLGFFQKVLILNKDGLVEPATDENAWNNEAVDEDLFCMDQPY